MNWRSFLTATLLGAILIGYAAMQRRTPGPTAVAPAPPSPGYYLKDAVITQTQADGSLGLRLSAAEIEQDLPENNIELRAVRVNYFHVPDKEWLLTADRASAPFGSPTITFRGNVLLRPADAEDAFLRTDALAIDTEDNTAHSIAAPTRVQFGPHTIDAAQFTADLTNEKLRMEAVDGRFSSP